MSEKRFVLDMSVIPNQILEDGEMMDKYKIVDKLNEQQSTIELLKKEGICLASMFEEQIKENKRLKEELTDCEKFRYTVFKRIEEVNDER